MTEPTNRRTSLTRAAVRVLAGVAGIVASVVVVTAAFSLPLPSSQAHAVARAVTPVPATASVACPGPLLQLGSANSASAVTALDVPTVFAGGDSTSPLPADLKQSNVNSNGTGPRAFEDPATDAAHDPLIAAGQADYQNTADMHGYAAANCAQPDFDQWLVGGATSLGATTLVVLGNPGAVTATVTIQAYSEQGLAASAGGTGIVVAPHSQRVVPLAGLVPNASATAVHVTSTGGTVSAQLQESEISGVTPHGVEWVGPTAAPGKRLVIPGAVFDGTAMSASATDSDDGGLPVLRVLPVGTKDARLTISVKAEGGKGNGTALSATVSHGVTSEIPLDKLGAGTYTITVDSTEPVVVAARTSTVSPKNGTDLAWFAAAAPLNGAAAIPLAATSGIVHLANSSDSPAKLALGGLVATTITVPAHTTISWAPGRAGVVTISDAQGVTASVTYAAAGLIASHVAYPTSASASALTVYKR